MIERPSLPERRVGADGIRPSAWRVVAACIVSIVAVLGLSPLSAAATADTDNTVLNSSPDNGALLSVSPESIVIVFQEDLGAGNTITVNCDAAPIEVGEVEVVDDTTLEAELPDALPSGTCTASWAVNGEEDQPNGSGVITFIVENDPAPVDGEAATGDTVADDGATDATTDTTPTTDVGGAETGDGGSDGDVAVVDLSVAGQGAGALWLGRLLSTLGIAVLFGSLLVIAAAWPEGVEYLVTVRFLRIVWGVALIGTLLFVSFASAAVTPDGGGSGFSPGTWFDLLDAGWAGRMALARLVFVIAAAWAAFRPDRVIDPTTQLVALGIPGIAAAVTGISRTVGDLAALGVVMGVIHALAMSVWVGGVVLLARVVLAGPGEEDLVHAVRGFSRISTPAIAVTIVSGLVQMFRLDGGQLFQSGHGRVVVLKTVVVAVMIFVAFSARQFVAKRVNRAQQMSVPLADRLRRAFGAEAAIGVLVLALSAWLLAFTPPNVDASPDISYAVTQDHVDAAEVIDVEVSFTDDVVGPIGMQVRVDEPQEGLNGLTVVLQAPPNELGLGSIVQPVPLTAPGFAVRDESVGLPIDVAGVWTVTVRANTAEGTVTSEPVAFTVRNADGSAPTTVVTAPPASVIEVTITDPPDEES